MKWFHEKIEQGFSAYARLVFHHWRAALVIVAVILALPISRLPELTIDTSVEGLLPAGDQILTDYNEFRDEFGRDLAVIAAISPPEVFSIPFLEKLTAFHDELAALPDVDQVTSLINATSIRSEEDSVIIGDLVEEMPADREALQILRETALGDRRLVNHLISEDGRFTVVLVKHNVYRGGPRSDSPARSLLSEKEISAFVAAVRDICDRYDSPDFPIALAGQAIVEETLKELTKKEIRRFALISILVIILILSLMFRCISGIVLPVLVVLLSLLATFGAMAMAGVPVTLNSQILPSFLLAVGICDSVHILALFYRLMGVSGNREEAITGALGHSGLAVMVTSLTTCGGLLSFATARVEPISHLGLFAAFGVILAFLLSITLMPALVAVLPIRRRPGQQPIGESSLDNLLLRITGLARRRPLPTIAVGAILLVCALMAAAGLSFSHNALLWLPENSAARQATHLIDRQMKGSLALEVVVDTEEQNGLVDPAMLHKIDLLEGLADTIGSGDFYVGKTLSINDALKDVNQALHGDDPDHYRLPEDRQLIAQEFLLLESDPDELSRLTGGHLRSARVTFKGPWVDAIFFARFLEKIEPMLHGLFEPGTKVTVTGLTKVMSRSLLGVMESMTRSYLIAGLAITLLMVIMIGDLRLGLISMLPNILPIALSLWLMALLDIPLDMATILVGSIVLGLAVDDTVHFLLTYSRNLERTGRVEEAIDRTTTTVGRALLFTTVILASGFVVFLFASQKSLVNFGIIASFAICSALLADLLLVPALVTLLARRRK